MMHCSHPILYSSLDENENQEMEGFTDVEDVNMLHILDAYSIILLTEFVKVKI